MPFTSSFVDEPLDIADFFFYPTALPSSFSIQMTLVEYPLRFFYNFDRVTTYVLTYPNRPANVVIVVMY